MRWGLGSDLLFSCDGGERGAPPGSGPRVLDVFLSSLFFSLFCRFLILFRSLCFTSLSPSSSLVPVDCVSDGDGGSGDEWQGEVRWVQKDSHCLFFFVVRDDTYNQILFWSLCFT